VRTCVLIVALVVGLLAAADAADAAELTFTSPDKLTLALPSDDYKTVWLRSDGAAGGNIEWQLVLDEHGDKPVVVGEDAKDTEPVLEVVGDTGIAENGAAPYRVRVQRLDAKSVKGAQLVARVSGAAPATLDVAVSAKPKPGPSVAWVLLAPLVVAAILMIVLGFVLDGGTVGTVDLDFSKSFATTLTAIGALLGTILSAGLIDDTAAPISKTGFQALNLTFGVLVLIAPLCFLVFQIRKEATEKGVKVSHYSGPSWAMLVASGVTLWAVLGQIWTIYLLLGEVDASGDISSLSITVIQVALGIGAVLAVVYSIRKLKWIVNTPGGSTAPGLSGFVATGALPDEVHQSWTPL
jgi:hypothetical protein